MHRGRIGAKPQADARRTALKQHRTCGLAAMKPGLNSRARLAAPICFAASGATW